MDYKSSTILVKKEEIRKFMLAFIKALSHSGYYAPDHPSAKKAFEGLYEQFLSLVGEFPELTFYRIETEEGPDIFIEGIEVEALQMSKFMTQASGELFIPRLVQYFIRKKLLSFTMKRVISEEEFRVFIGILSQAPEADVQQKAQEKDDLNIKLAEADVINVSLSFEADLVGRERKLPWRVEMALTRLKRDLRYLPMYKDLNEEQIAEAKLRVLRDIIRPLRRPYILKDFLLSCDLIHLGSSTLEVDDLDQMIISVIPPELITAVIKEILKDWEIYEKQKSEGDENVLYMYNRIEEIIRNLANKFTECRDESDFEAIMFLYVKNIISFNKLPEELKNEILTKEWLQEFYFAEEELFNRIYNEKDMTYFVVEVRKLTAIMPKLLAKEDLESAIRIIEFLKELIFTCSDTFGEKSKTLREIMAELPTHPVFFERLKEIYHKSDRDTRQQVEQIFSSFKREATPTLFEILGTTDKKSVRKNALNTVISFKHEATPYIKRILKDKETPWFNVRNALNILRAIGDKRLSSDIVPFLDYPDGRVRITALTAIAELLGRKGLNHWKHLLRDKDLAVKKKVVTWISKLGDIDEDVLNYFGKYLQAFPQKGDQDFEKLQFYIMRTIVYLPKDLKWNGLQTFEQLLWQIYEQEHGTTKLQRFLSTRNVRSQEYLEVMAETLKKISTDQARLRKLDLKE